MCCQKSSAPGLSNNNNLWHHWKQKRWSRRQTCKFYILQNLSIVQRISCSCETASRNKKKFSTITSMWRWTGGIKSIYHSDLILCVCVCVHAGLKVKRSSENDSSARTIPKCFCVCIVGFLCCDKTRELWFRRQWGLLCNMQSDPQAKPKNNKHSSLPLKYCSHSLTLSVTVIQI